MKTIARIFAAMLLAGAVSLHVYAGNGDRAGQAGAGELLINPWARSSGWAGANSACVRGLESLHLNVAGIAFTPQTELIFARTAWLKGSEIFINSFGITQKVSESGVMGLSVMSMDFGDIQVTTTDLPEGGFGTFRPRFLNIGVSYAKAFSNSIYGGMALKVLHEGIANVSAQGMALDAGIQYVTGIGKNKAGKKNTDNLKFGIALKNVGPSLRFSGDGLALTGTMASSGLSLTVEQRVEKFEMPSLLNIGASYDFKITENHKWTTAITFTSNSFSKDQYQAGLQYGFRTYFMVRAGYLFEKESGDKDLTTNALTGPTAGFTFEIPLKKDSGKTFGFDYSYRATNPFQGVHSIGARINL